MFTRFAILGLVFVHVFMACTVAQDICEGYDPNTFDPNTLGPMYDTPHLLDNSLFEDGCSLLTNYYSSTNPFVPPVYWKRTLYSASTNTSVDDCYAGIHSSFVPPLREENWEIPYPFEGETFVLLSTGSYKSFPDGDSDVKGAKISQKIYLDGGDTILGAYFFGTADYLHFNDYGQISLISAADANDFPDPNDMPPNIAPIPGTLCNVEMVGNYESTQKFSPETGGWISFSYTVEPNQTGPYYLQCEVVDVSDAKVNSYYAVDGLLICKGGLSQADLNFDCNVNLEDFSLLSQAWLTFCPDPPIDDPNFPGDPNDYPAVPDPNLLEICEAADFDKSWYIDVNDLLFMSDEWLH